MKLFLTEGSMVEVRCRKCRQYVWIQGVRRGQAVFVRENGGLTAAAT
jgi:hypothetical protein